MVRRKALFALAVTSVFLLSALGPLTAALPVLGKEDQKLWQSQGSEDPPEYQEGDDYKDIFLYFHRTSGTEQYVLDTQGGSNGVDIMPNAQSVTFRLVDPLTKNLMVLGHEIDATHKGFWLDLGVSAVPSATVTIEVLDGAMVVANTSREITGSFSRWNVPFLSGQDSYTFLKGNEIGVRISTTGSTTITYGSNDKLWVLCDPISLTGDTYNSNGVKAKTFYPNAIEEERHVMIRGKVNDAWGPSDIADVFVDIRDPTGASVVNATAELDGLNYTYDWNYTGGRQAGSYQAVVTMHDQQNNAYEIRIDFTMATYGVHLDSPAAQDAGIISGSVEVGGCMEYTVSVLNTGASATSYTISQSSSDVSGWTLSVTPSQTGTVQPGESVLVEVRVCAEDSVEEGTQAVFYVQAVATADPTAKDTIQMITNAVPKINLTLLWTTISNTCSNLVNTGGTVNCSFELKNSGLETLNISMNMNMQKGSPDWTASVSPSSIISNNLVLHPDQAIGGTLTITAPDDPSMINETIINIHAQTTDIEPPLTKTLTAKTVMSTGIDIVVQGDDTRKIDSDKTAEFYIMVYNTDPNNEHTIILTAVSPSGWKVEFKAGTASFSLNAQESQRVTVEVDPDDNDPARSYAIEITGKYQDNPQTWDKVDLNVEIKENHAIEMTVTPADETIGAGETAEFRVVITNKGNVDEKSLYLTVLSTDDDFKSTISIDSNSSHDKTVNIARGQSETIIVKVEPKDDMKHLDEGAFQIKAKSAHGETVTKSVTVKVEKDLPDRIPDVLKDIYIMMLIVLTIVVIVLYGMASKKASA